MFNRHFRILSVAVLPLAASPTYTALLATAVILPLAACSSSSSTTSSTLSDDIALLAKGLKSLLSYAHLSDSTMARYQAYIDDLGKLASAVASNMVDGKSAMHQAVADAQAALDIVSGMNLSATAKTIVAAVETVLAVLQAMGTFSSAHPVAQHSMTPDQARAILRDAR